MTHPRGKEGTEVEAQAIIFFVISAPSNDPELDLISLITVSVMEQINTKVLENGQKEWPLHSAEALADQAGKGERKAGPRSGRWWVTGQDPELVPTVFAEVL